MKILPFLCTFCTSRNRVPCFSILTSQRLHGLVTAARAAAAKVREHAWCRFRGDSNILEPAGLSSGALTGNFTRTTLTPCSASSLSFVSFTLTSTGSCEFRLPTGLLPALFLDTLSTQRTSTVIWEKSTWTFALTRQ